MIAACNHTPVLMHIVFLLPIRSVDLLKQQTACTIHAVQTVHIISLVSLQQYHTCSWSRLFF